MRRPAGGFLARRMSAAGTLLGSVMLTAFIAAALVGTLAGFDLQVLPQAVHWHLARSRMSIAVIGVGNASTSRAGTAAIRRLVGTAMAGAGYRLDGAVWSAPLTLGGPGGKAGPPGEAAAAAEIRAHAALTAGAWPGPPRPRQPIPGALPAAAASGLHARPGTVIAVRDRNTGARLRLRVTGLYRQRDPASRYWDLDRIWTCGASTRHCFTSHGPIAVSPAAFGGAGLTVAQSSWVVLPDPGRIGAGTLTGLAGRIGRAAARLQGPGLGLVVTTDMPGILRSTARALVVARSQLAIAALELLLPAVAALALAARLLASRREEESALLRARGAARWQLARPDLAEAAAAGAVAVAAGTLAGSGLARLLAATGPLRQAGIRPAGLPPPVWLPELAVLVLCAVVMLWPALRPAGPGAGRGRPAALATAVAAGTDVLLLGLAAASGWELHAYSAVTRSPSGPIGIDPVLAVAPALALAGVSLIPLRLLPGVAGLLDRMAAAGRRLGTALASWEFSRRRVRQAGPVLLAVLAVATGTMALAQYESWHRSALDQAAFTAGTDVRVEAPAPVPAGRAAALARAPGVTAAMPLARLGTGTGSEVLALDARAAPATVLLRPDLSPVPAAALWRRITPPGRPPGLVLPGRPARLQLLARLSPADPAGPGGRPAAAPVTVSVQAAGGSVYPVPAGHLQADGHRHALVAALPAAAATGYPLRLTGVSVTGPPPPGAAGGGAGRGHPARLTVSRIAVTAPGAGGSGTPAASASGLRAWRHAAAPDGTVSLTAPAPSRVIPAIATRAFLRGHHIGVGTALPVPLGSASVVVRVVAGVPAFPTVTGGALIVDLTAAQGALAGRGDLPLPVTSWWLRAPAGAALPALPAGSAVVTRSRQAAALLGDPLPAAPQQADLAVAAAVALLAAVGFAISVAASVRARRGQSALLAALGVGRAAQARALCAEQLMVSVPAAAAGLLAGAGLARLLVPAITLTPAAAAPVPPVLVELPLGRAAALALAVAAIPPLVAAATAARRADPAARLRAAAP